ncbi:sensor histidine kinase [Paenibacillus dakarensis]|uniref:sensor histidine kinase n=1 Tax=Paenibacillus dakarensis TaxID=1527293 RepID=UPI0006D59507|nr:sensor histidine kinase [Paenibacillus dakarensis]
MLRKNSIFIKILMLMVSSIIIISILLMLASSYISERILLEQVVRSASANMNLMKNDLLDYNGQVVNTMLQVNRSSEFKDYITKPTNTSLEEIKLVIALGRYMDLYKDYLSPENSHIIVSGIPGEGGRHYSSNSLKWDKVPQDFISKFMSEDGQFQNRIQYYSSLDLFSESVPYDNYLFAVKPLIESSSNRMYGYVAVIMDELNIYRKYKPYISDGIHISLIASDGSVLSSSIKEQISMKDTELLAVAENSSKEQNGIWSDMGNKKTYISYFLPEYNAYLVEEIDQHTAFAPLYKISSDIMKVVPFILIISMLFVYSLSRRITRPLYKLVKTMQASTGNNLKYQPLQEGASYETNVLTKAYNRFIKVIDQYTEKLVFEQQERRKADLNALQMQINPHFLYNTLSSIKYLAKMNRIDQVDETINSLISMLQNTIGSTEDRVTIEQEIETLKHFVYIKQIRYGNEIRVHYEIEENCLPLLVPKLILQPFVENSFFHAFAGKSSGNIHIFIRRQEDLLIIEIIDDGVGMAAVEDQMREQKKRHHLSGIGISNVHSRIQLLFGSSYGVQIESEPGYGTSVRISLPLLERQGLEDSRLPSH